MSNTQALHFAVLATRESSAATLYGMYDMFSSVGRDWGLLTGGSPGESLITPQIVSRDGAGFHSPNGAWVQPQCSIADCAAPDLICIPDLLVAPGQSIQKAYEQECAWIKQCFQNGAYMATACTGALLLAEAGLLDGLETTTHWAYCDAMRTQYPAVTVRGDRSMVVTGEGQRLLMAGGGTSWLDLALLVVARFFGTEEAMRLARIYLIDWHQLGQQPYAVLTVPSSNDDALIAKCQQWVAQHYDEESPVAKMAAMSGLSDRSFTRRFAKATGMSPLEYVHALRLEEAKQMLETTSDSIESIANEMGYEDSGFFGSLFRRKVGLTPTQYRKRFGQLRESIVQLRGKN